MVVEPLELSQQYRAFNLASPWDQRLDNKTRVEVEAGEGGGGGGGGGGGDPGAGGKETSSSK